MKLFNLFKPKKVELEFVHMEWWGNPNEDGLGQAVRGVTRDAKIYLTFDIRKDKGDLYPVFSHHCEVGGHTGHRQEAYEYYRAQFHTLEGYKVHTLDNCDFRMKDNISNKIKFKRNAQI